LPLKPEEQPQRTLADAIRDATRAIWEKRMAWYHRHPGTPASKAFSDAIGQDK
jgi:hypothetical protein